MPIYMYKRKELALALQDAIKENIFTKTTVHALGPFESVASSQFWDSVMTKGIPEKIGNVNINIFLYSMFGVTVEVL